MSNSKIQVEVYAISDDAIHTMTTKDSNLKALISSETITSSALYWMTNPDFKGTVNAEIKDVKKEPNAGCFIYSVILEIEKEDCPTYRELIQKEGGYRIRKA